MDANTMIARYVVVPVTRYVVQSYFSDAEEKTGGVAECGEFRTEEMAKRVAEVLAEAEPHILGGA